MFVDTAIRLYMYVDTAIIRLYTVKRLYMHVDMAIQLYTYVDTAVIRLYTTIRL